jgi:tRNA(Ile)-lysidine synthase
MKRDIPFKTIDVLYYPKYGNFEAWARNVRYNFFSETIKENCAEGVFVAHHKDDLLETYLMQKQRNIITKYYGLKEEIELFGVRVIRPLLNFYKEELLNYCDQRKIEYSIDSTNLENDHLRNKIRNTILIKYSREEKEKLLIKINKDNEKRKKNLINIQEFLHQDRVDINQFNKLESIEKQMVIYELINKKVDKENIKLTYYRIHELIRTLQGEKPNVCIKLSGTYYFIREYNYFYVDRWIENRNFSYIMEEPSFLETEEFSCDFRCDTSDIKIYPSSYPLLFRNARVEDKVKIGDITKKVNRLLIDEKIPLRKRKNYPIVIDKQGKIVYIPLYRSHIQKKIANKLKFMVK